MGGAEAVHGGKDGEWCRGSRLCGKEVAQGGRSGNGGKGRWRPDVAGNVEAAGAGGRQQPELEQLPIPLPPIVLNSKMRSSSPPC